MSAENQKCHRCAAPAHYLVSFAVGGQYVADEFWLCRTCAARMMAAPTKPPPERCPECQARASRLEPAA